MKEGEQHERGEHNSEGERKGRLQTRKGRCKHDWGSAGREGTGGIGRCQRCTAAGGV